MQEIIDNIHKIGTAYKGRPLNTDKLILCQKKLKLNNLPLIPQEYVDFLHKYNSLACDGRWLFGVCPRDESDLDILTENALTPMANKTANLILGYSELEYLLWNETESHYQIVDKSDFEVLKTYQTCKDALWDFLRLDDCY